MCLDDPGDRSTRRAVFAPCQHAFKVRMLGRTKMLLSELDGRETVLKRPYPPERLMSTSFADWC